jgi:tetratricopeptide (TPR) repeat protein
VVVGLMAASAPAWAADRSAVSLCLSPPPAASAIEACRIAERLDLPAGRAGHVRLSLARALTGAQRYAEALEAYRDAARLAPDDAEGRLRVAEALLHLQGDPQSAVDETRSALLLDPRSARAYGLLGAALLALGQPAEASAAFAEAARLDPEYFSRRPAAREMDEASRRGAAWPAAADQPAVAGS